MSIQYPLDFLWIDFIAADIDDSAAAADKIITIAAPLNEIGGVDETMAVEKRRGQTDLQIWTRFGLT